MNELDEEVAHPGNGISTSKTTAFGQFGNSALNADPVFIQTMGGSPMSGMGSAENIMHSTIRVGGSTIMSDDPSPAGPVGAGRVSLAIGLDDPEQANKCLGTSRTAAQ